MHDLGQILRNEPGSGLHQAQDRDQWQALVNRWGTINFSRRTLLHAVSYGKMHWSHLPQISCVAGKARDL